MTQIFSDKTKKEGGKSTGVKRNNQTGSHQIKLIQMIAVTPKANNIETGSKTIKCHYRTLSFSYRLKHVNYVTFDCAQPDDLVMEMVNQIGHPAYMYQWWIGGGFMIFGSVRFSDM